jgi:hypothetical protein
MKTKLFFIVPFIFFIACNSGRDKKKGDELTEQPKETSTPPPAEVKPAPLGNKFFEYDEIDYYSIPTMEGPKRNENSVTAKTENYDSLEEAVYSFDTPRNMDDLSFIGKLESLSYHKGTIPKNIFSSIDSIFSEKSVDIRDFTHCIPEYRDILIFKRQTKIIGVAKVCFQCEQYHIIGTKANTENFGQNGDYEKLALLLGKKNAMHWQH